jgi:hypothetical protein
MANIMTTTGTVGASATVSTAVLTLVDDFGFTAAQLAKAERALITSTKAAVRYRHDGTAPTDELGHFLPQDASPPLEVLGNLNIRQFQCIRDSEENDDAVVLITLEF